jgi:hypothetical protein
MALSIKSTQVDSLVGRCQHAFRDRGERIAMMRKLWRVIPC